MRATLVKPAPQRHVSEDIAGSYVLTIPSPRKWLLILYLVFQFVVWAVLEIFVLTVVIRMLAMQRIPDAAVFLAIWLLLFSATGLVALYALLWQVIGKERIEITGQSLILSRNMQWFMRPKEYEASSLKDLRVSQPTRSRAPWGLMLEEWGLSGGLIAFDYGAKTHRFGIGLDEAEAKQIVAEIQQKYPRYR